MKSGAGVCLVRCEKRKPSKLARANRPESVVHRVVRHTLADFHLGGCETPMAKAAKEVSGGRARILSPNPNSERSLFAFTSIRFGILRPKLRSPAQ